MRWHRLVGAAAMVAVVLPGATAPSSAMAAASNGTLRGSVAVALRPSVGVASKIQAINASDGTTAASGPVAASGGFSLSVPPGIYLVVVEKISRRAGPVRGFGRLARVQRGRISVVPAINPGSAVPRARSGLTALRATGESASSVASAAGSQFAAAQSRLPAIAVKYFPATGPNAFLGKGLADMLMTDLGGSKCYMQVEWARRADLLAEIRFQQSRFVDPSTRVTPRFIQPDFFIEGSMTTTPTSQTWDIRAREIATGRIISSDRRTSGADFFQAEAALAKKLRTDLDKELCQPARFTGSFSTTITSAEGTVTFNGTVTFVRGAGQSLSQTTDVIYDFQRADYTATANWTVSGCSGTATVPMSVVGDSSGQSWLFLAPRTTPRKGRAYRLAMRLLVPPANITMVCPGLPSIVTQWSPGATINDGTLTTYYTQAMRRLQGTNSLPAGYSSSWDLTGIG